MTLRPSGTGCSARAGCVGSMSRQNMCWRRSVPSKTHDAQAARHLVERVEEHRLALAVDVEALLEEVLVAQDVLVERPGVLGQAERGERALPLGQVDASRPTGSRPASPGFPGRC